MNLSGRHVIVTGAGAGIGLGIARACRAAGAEVTGFDRSTEGCNRLEETGARFVQVDVTDLDGFEAAISEAHARMGRLDGMVNNAGVTIKVPFLEMTRDQMETLWTVNQRSVLVGCQAAGRIMAAAGRGAIVNLSSVHARATNPGHEGYAGTKAAIAAMTRAMAWSLGPEGVRVNAICPAMTRTEIVDEAMKDPTKDALFRSWTADGEVTTVDEIGTLAVFLLSDAGAALNGSEVVADRAMSALLDVFDVKGKKDG
ncbi:SDR family NAD(P)-dependent oxidoreductase [Vannielia litorea]|uniref:3-oxoacyl-[acyl-carrier protein] reductase n=1 Tax=Vannielia litorea TaxID=1217970 RepID=A0A1N6DZN8_9RHOB|nr:SDR family oxidoreductase [Vannielia litorea]SIN76240.1 3-oxoacyl-[acyl-carrier protein] reductase [Vannielia litorea]